MIDRSQKNIVKALAQRLSSALLVVLATAVHAQSVPAQRHGPAFGTFSNLRYFEETGDVAGIEITIVPQYMTAYAIFQCAEGQPSDPVFVPVSLKGNQIKFTIRNGDASCDGVYTATITDQGMKLTAGSETAGHEAYTVSEFLPRRASYWSR